MASSPPMAGLRALEAVARRRSFALAAAELHLTASAVSHQIARLEADFGVRLFERSAHGVWLSAAGERYLLRVAGALFLPWAALVAWVGLRAVNPPRLVGAIVALNLVYVLDCVLFAAVAQPWFGVAPTGLGLAFLLAQAAAVLAFSLGQWAGMRQGRGALATSP